jgi:hypothetical protein
VADLVIEPVTEGLTDGVTEPLPDFEGVLELDEVVEAVPVPVLVLLSVPEVDCVLDDVVVVVPDLVLDVV